ncbi:O-antigen ligase family protein [Caldilinea sp.]|uniref:O-antigen ligase family protein n=1 Tax=Caldilinea sp. TaxID=2293560 RepID=UPI002636639A|nr:O-antigen ligase family protein [uncultured Caldilinea sp.]
MQSIRVRVPAAIGGAALALGLLWLALTSPLRACADCGATLTPAPRLTSGALASVESPALAFSPGWTVDANGADPSEPTDPFSEPSGVITFTYAGDALWLLLAPGDYWAYLYATVDDRPANRLVNIPGNVNSLGAAAGYRTLLAPELAGAPEDRRLRWVEIHRHAQRAEAPASSAHVVRLEFWRGWGQKPLRGVAVDPPTHALHRPGERLPVLPAPQWPGALLMMTGFWFLAATLTPTLKAKLSRSPLPRLRRFDLSSPSWQRGAWIAFGLGAALTIAGTALDRWLLAPAGVLLLAAAGVVRPALWLAALLFALPFAYAVDLPLLPTRALGIVDVGVLGGAATLAGHWALRSLSGEKRPPGAPSLEGEQRAALWLLALIGSWALIASLDVWYPALALREWRVVFLSALIFGGVGIGVVRLSWEPALDRQLLVAGWLLGATTVALIGLWGYVSGQGFVSAAEGVRRVQALYDSPNNLALYLDRTLAVTLSLALFVEGWRRRVFWGALAAVQALAWLLTFSKGALLLAAPAMALTLAAGGVWMVRRRRASLKPLLALGAFLLLAALVLTPFLGAERFQRLLDFEQGTGFLRLQLWRSAWAMALDHPWLGVGPDQFLYHYRSVYLLPEAWQEPNLNHPHNFVLDWWTRLGLVGLLLGVSWWGVGIWGIWRWLRGSSEQRDEAALALGCLAAAFAALAHGLIDVSYALPELMLTWTLLFHWKTAR